MAECLIKRGGSGLKIIDPSNILYASGYEGSATYTATENCFVVAYGNPIYMKINDVNLFNTSASANYGASFSGVIKKGDKIYVEWKSGSYHFSLKAFGLRSC